MFNLKTSLLLSVSVLALVLATPIRALAWADLGHSIVGGIAEENIKPTTKDFVRGVLGIEPLGAAAVWPDHVRDDDRFAQKDSGHVSGANNPHGFNEYHFCEIPVGYTYANRPKKYLKDCHGAILGAIELLKDVKGDHTRAEKMIALRYLAHLMGDITQPLHVGNGYDMGGNVCQIKWQKSANAKPAQMNLHAFWDDTMVTNLGVSYADPIKGRKAAIYYSQFLPVMKEKRPDMFTDAAKKKYFVGTLEDWLGEAALLRETGVYPDAPGAMTGVAKGEEYKNRPYCLWFSDQTAGTLGAGSKIDNSKIPVVGSAYADQFNTVVESQLLIGGLRLAAALDDIADTVAASLKPLKTLNDAQQERTLKNVQKAFFNAPSNTDKL
jgi:hypothetical protein